MKKLIVTADDFGYTKSINDGIVRAVKEGVVTDIAVMVLTDPEDLSHAVNLATKNKITSLGLHTSLFHWGKSNRPNRSDYVNFFINASDDEIKSKAMSEIKVFENIFGQKPDFISPQYNMHGNLRLLKHLADYSIKNNIPMRIPRAVIENDEITDKNYSAEVFLKRMGVKMTNHLFAHILGSSATDIVELFKNELESVKGNETTELIFHPGYMDTTILESSSLNFERARDLAIVLDKKFKKDIKNMGFTLTHMINI